MACVPLEQNAYEAGPRDYLNHYLHIMSKLRGGQRYVPLLLSKAHDALPCMMESQIPRTLTSSPVDGHFELACEDTVATPCFGLDLESSFLPPAHKTEFANGSDNCKSFSPLHQSLSPAAISYSPVGVLPV